MKKMIFNLSLLSCLTMGIAHADDKMDTVLYVCGGNTGRSVMADWFTRSNYHSVNTFSRGSGIDPNDSAEVEENARILIEAEGEATTREMNTQRATPASLTDINKATIILTMGTKYNERLKNLIDRECSDFNLNYPNRSFNKDQWISMCANKEQLKSKIHTLIGCATGVDGDIPDAFGQNLNFYIQTREMIKSNITLVMENHKKNNEWCVPNSTLSKQATRFFVK